MDASTDVEGGSGFGCRREPSGCPMLDARHPSLAWRELWMAAATCAGRSPRTLEPCQPSPARAATALRSRPAVTRL